MTRSSDKFIWFAHGVLSAQLLRFVWSQFYIEAVQRFYSECGVGERCFLRTSDVAAAYAVYSSASEINCKSYFAVRKAWEYRFNAIEYAKGHSR